MVDARVNTKNKNLESYTKKKAKFLQHNYRNTSQYNLGIFNM